MTREERKEAIEYLKKYRELDKQLYQTAPFTSVAHNALVKCLRHWDTTIKALEQESQMGYWIKHNTPNNTYYYDCSLCGCVAPCTETADSYLWKLSNFCPDCGAKMESEK